MPPGGVPRPDLPAQPRFASQLTSIETPQAGERRDQARAALGNVGKRLGANLLDTLVFVVAPTLAGALLGAAWGSAAAEGGAIAGVILGSLLYVFGRPALMARNGEHNGQTPAKQWLGLRVVRQNGQPVTFGVAALREIVGISLINAFCGIWFVPDSLWCTWDDRRQTLHDKIGSTYVFDAGADPGLAPDLAPPVYVGTGGTGAPAGVAPGLGLDDPATQAPPPPPAPPPPSPAPPQ